MRQWWQRWKGWMHQRNPGHQRTIMLALIVHHHGDDPTRVIEEHRREYPICDLKTPKEVV